MQNFDKVSSFLSSGKRNQWCRFDAFCIDAYLRNTTRWRNGELVDTLDIGSFQVDEDEQGKGNFTRFIENAEEAARFHDKIIFVENVLTEFVQKFFEKRGYDKAVIASIPSYYYDPVGAPCLDLPEKCYGWHPSKEKIILIKKGKCGFFEADIDGKKEDINRLNKELGVNVAQREAMETGSMMGWSVPGADPANHAHMLEESK